MPDGTALAWGNVGQLTFSNESLKEGTINLPFSFVSGFAYVTPYNTSNFALMLWAGASLQNGNQLEWSLATVSQAAISVANRGFTWLVVGRWK